jgi:hypothetical protein
MKYPVNVTLYNERWNVRTWLKITSHVRSTVRWIKTYVCFVCLMVFNVTFNNISAISWRSDLLVEKTTNLSQVTDKLYHIMLYTSLWSKFELSTSVVIGTDCIGSCKFSYHTIKVTKAPITLWNNRVNVTLYTCTCI